MRINNIFGPTIQGEGPLLGVPSMFVRVQGCDSRCPWCDTPQAQDRKLGTELTPSDVVERLSALLGERPTSPGWVTLTGGNPCMEGEEMRDLIQGLHAFFGLQVAVETQGTLWRSWLLDVEKVIVSPKPWEYVDWRFYGFTSGEDAWKIIVFGQPDIAWAGDLAGKLQKPIYLQAGAIRGEDAMGYLARARELAQMILDHPESSMMIFTPQWHRLLWGSDPDR
jgi:7-carboxy-7-deazaguanine synthase